MTFQWIFKGFSMDFQIFKWIFDGFSMVFQWILNGVVIVFWRFLAAPGSVKTHLITPFVLGFREMRSPGTSTS